MNSFSTSREIPAAPEQVLAAFSDPERLSRWWGPAGFTNTFHFFEFKEGGNWKYTMHGPDGRNYRNESVFEKINLPDRIIIRHISEPKYRLIISLTPSSQGTIVEWEQTFEREGVAERIKHIVVPANEENLDRLTGEVLQMNPGK